MRFSLSTLTHHDKSKNVLALSRLKGMEWTKFKKSLFISSAVCKKSQKKFIYIHPHQIFLLVDDTFFEKTQIKKKWTCFSVQKKRKKWKCFLPSRKQKVKQQFVNLKPSEKFHQGHWRFRAKNGSTSNALKTVENSTPREFEAVWKVSSGALTISCKKWIYFKYPENSFQCGLLWWKKMNKKKVCQRHQAMCWKSVFFFFSHSFIQE